ncbi:MAG: hypothetical protein WAJ93_08575 [Candidatus Nitrosopolaris sp.]
MQANSNRWILTFKSNLILEGRNQDIGGDYTCANQNQPTTVKASPNHPSRRQYADAPRMNMMAFTSPEDLMKNLPGPWAEAAR